MKVYNGSLYYALNNVNILKALRGRHFVVAINRATNNILTELKLLETIKEESKEFKSFKKEGDALREKYADRNEDNSISKEILNKGTSQEQIKYNIIKNKTEFDNSYATLTTKYKVTIDDATNKNNEYLKVLNEITKYEQIELEETDLPDNISCEQFEIVNILLDIK